MVATSTDGGLTWSSPVKVNPGTTTDYVNRYNASISGSGDGILHITYRSRQEAAHLADFAPSAQTYYQESSDGGKTWSTPLLVSTPANNLYYGAFSRSGTFEGDYNGIASAGGYSYVVRDEAYAAFAGEPVALTPDPANPEQLVLSGKGHQHQQTWVAVVGPAVASSVAPSGATPSPSAQPVSPAAVGATIGTPNTSAASSTSARVTLLAVGGLLAVVVYLGRRRRRT
jgi:hypothetical protein